MGTVRGGLLTTHGLADGVSIPHTFTAVARTHEAQLNRQPPQFITKGLEQGSSQGGR
jgi:hypothetical protein